MRPWERAASFLFGLGFGGAGVYAIFTTTNQVGSAALVIAGAAFSLIAVQGTRLIRLGSGSASVEMDRLRQAAKIIRQAEAEAERDPERAEGMIEAAAIISPELAESPQQQAMRYEDRVHQALLRTGFKVQREYRLAGDFGFDFLIEDAGKRHAVVEARFLSHGPLTRPYVNQVLGKVESANDDLIRKAGVLYITNAPLSGEVQEFNTRRPADARPVEIITWNDERDDGILVRSLSRVAR
jgi:hypothetical protein